MHAMKAQSALEYMMIVGTVLLIMAPIVYYAYQYNETAVRTSQARLAASRISAAAESLYAQGPGAKMALDVFLPAGYSAQSYASGNILDIKINTPAGFNDVLEVTKANFTGSLPGESGYRRIFLVMLDSGGVNITE